MRRRTLITLLAVRWGFAFIVAMAITAAVTAAATVAIPADIPSVALGAVPVYRVEVGAGVFLGLYLTAMALFLAMHNRAFTDIGTSGFRAQDLAAEERYVDFEELVMDVMEEVQDLKPGREERERGDQEAA
jgi:hypothetical protein